MTSKKLTPIFCALCLFGASHAHAQTQPFVFSNNNKILAAQAKDGIAAYVNDSIILKSELAAAIADLGNQAKANNIAISQAQLRQTALDALILRKLQLGIIERADFQVNEDAINRQLLQVAKNNQLDSLQALQQTLDAQVKGSYATLRQELINEAALSALNQQQAASRIQISQADINAFLSSPEARNLNPTEYRSVHIRVPYLDDYVRLSDNQRDEAYLVAMKIKHALEKGETPRIAIRQSSGNYPREIQQAEINYTPAQYLPNELVNTITALQKGEVSLPIVTAEGIDVIMLTDKRTTSMVIPEWHTSHILVRIDNVQNEALAKQKIDALYRQLQQGAKFDTLAATYSDDTGSASQKGSLGWVNEGKMVAEFEQIMKSTQKGTFSKPFRTQFGWHILAVNDTRQRDVTQEYRRATAEEILFNRQLPQAQEDWLQELRSSAYIKIVE